MIHFLYLIGFGVLVATAFAAFHTGNGARDRVLYGLKVFAQFVVISLVLAWIFYFIP
ncbi:MAG TPA: hypothetical protein VK400_11170 [Pyrinomonadaceae bacterium]|nr:hypothetical protein [Pyrinomonadaceae bacterium]